MTTLTADVAIVGAGVEGLSVAWALSERGITDVVVLDRSSVGAGFTAKSSGIVRCHYGVPSLAAMAHHSLPLLEGCPAMLGADIGFHRTGYVVIVAEEDVDALLANVRRQQSLGIDTEMLDLQELGRLFPNMRIDDIAAAAIEPRGGYADAYSTAQAFSQAARARGVRLRQNEPVITIELGTSGAIDLTLGSGTRVSAGAAVVAAGPWSAQLVSPLGVDVPLRALREQLMIVDPGMPVDGLPVLSDLVSLQYLRQEGPDHLLVGNSDHHAAQHVDPDNYVDSMDDDRLLGSIEKFVHRFPSFENVGLVSTYAGCYDITPDFNPIIGPSGVDGLYLCTGFSGHGFKIAPAVGQLMADLVTTGVSSMPNVDARDFRLSRFSDGDLLLSPTPYAGAPEMR